MNPPFLETDGEVVRCCEPVRDSNAGGDLAFAFTSPPDGLRLRRSQLQPLFDEIMDFVLPGSLDVEIRDWHSPELPHLFGYFAEGPKSWGVFLFSLYVSKLSRLTIVAGAPWD